MEQAEKTLSEKHLRAIMVAKNRDRANYLRSRQWSDKALDALAWHAFALAMDRDGDEVVRDAIKRYADLSRTYRGEPVDPRAAWLNAYGIVRCLATRIRGRS